MQRYCANCGIAQGPFDRKSIEGKLICRNTPQQPNRIAECVKRRERADAVESKIDIPEE